ncbi:cotranscriptional regulator ARB2A homolog [Nothobranchius furzeri]|uniref:Family with sequence similarity 172, member A n=1 Tax=Nothobranchius furzeri TaxID=105023 RepID=A0A1A8B7E5_NOTFU|nr:cotranscriptional regulator FAM172A homolog [Nothobranchius furzeri]XP_015827910.1 cotranscriptional regulator FAM172A homolog [Nothobranchius furzeri]XP_054587676.1 cotranscriptional regulator FAM172A homolog [Nothobranchius furzeri]KAF7200068.1 transcript variant X1 [Nothobranchius furzeri]KAF7200069.1 transcript variant X2 [Nothobranchius furzeri]
MLSHLCAATSALYILWITMAHVAGQDDRERTTALKDLLSRIDLDELMKKDEPPFNFPQTLEEFEYAFNEYGQLRHTKTGEPFVFNAREDLHRWNQKRYEALGEIITEYVYELLEKECNMTKAILPVDAEGDEPTSFIYLSPDALSNPSKLLVLIQGSGVVRAGQWARRLIINQDLNSGTQIPFIRRAMEEGFGVVVLNPNLNYLEVEKAPKSSPSHPPAEVSDEPAEKRERKDEQEGKKKREFYEKYRNPQKETETERIPIRENSSSEDHVLYVWDHFVSRAAAKNVFIMAHSYGGLSFVEMMNQREVQVKNRVCAVAFTDSAHNLWLQETTKGTQDWIFQYCSNWVSSPEPLDTPLDSMLPDCPKVSAGTERHELTSWTSFDSIFRFFAEALKAREDEEAEENSNPVTTRRSSFRNKHQDL